MLTAGWLIAAVLVAVLITSWITLNASTTSTTIAMAARCLLSTSMPATYSAPGNVSTIPRRKAFHGDAF